MPPNIKFPQRYMKLLPSNINPAPNNNLGGIIATVNNKLPSLPHPNVISLFATFKFISSYFKHGKIWISHEHQVTGRSVIRKVIDRVQVNGHLVASHSLSGFLSRCHLKQEIRATVAV